MIHRFFRRFSTGNSQSKAAQDATRAFLDEFKALRERVHRLEIDLKERTDQLEQLGAHLHKLRGKVYGGLNGAGKGQGAIPYGDKDALRAYAGLTASRRFQHEE